MGWAVLGHGRRKPVSLAGAKAYLEPEEVDCLEKAAACVRDRLLIRLLFHLGCRISEALALTVQDIDPQQGTVTIQHLKTRIRLSCLKCGARLGRRHRFCPECGGEVDEVAMRQQEHRRMRMLPLDVDTLDMMADLIRKHDGNGLIFGINRHRAWQIVRECARRAGLPDLLNPETGKVRGISPHRLRDAFAVMAVRRDDSTDGIRMLQEWLGHTNIGTTMRYRKVAGQELKEWYQKLWDATHEWGVRRQQKQDT